MFRIVPLILLLSTLSMPASYGQVCTHTRLSKKYNFKTNIHRIPRGADFDSFVVNVKIFDKSKRKEIQEIIINSTYLYSGDFVKCNSVRSYTTGLNKNMAVNDNDFGDLVVADFNFDGKEDLALKKDSGGNGGPLYNFYIQKAGGKFVLDSFLTDQVEFFPTHINRRSKTLVTLVHANAYQMGEHTYKLDAKRNQWNEIKHRFVTVH